MASGVDPCPEHPKPTATRLLRYCFSAAHHGHGILDDSQWAGDLGRLEEFNIFALADRDDLSDFKGNLYGLRLGDAGAILQLGTRGEQVAKFWEAHQGQSWHGYPLWPLGTSGPENRRKHPAPRDALRKMEAVGLLTAAQRRRLQKGDRIR